MNRHMARRGWRQLLRVLARFLILRDLAKSLVTLPVLSAGNKQDQEYYADDVTAHQTAAPRCGTAGT